MGRRTRTRTGNRVGRREGASGCRPPPPTPPSSATERCFMCFVEEHSLALLSLSLLSSVGGAAVATAAAAMRLQLQLRPLAARREKNKLTVVGGHLWFYRLRSKISSIIESTIFTSTIFCSTLFLLYRIGSTVFVSTDFCSK